LEINFSLLIFDVSNEQRYYMILSFGSKETEKIWNGERVSNMPMDIQNIGRRKLRMLNNSIDIKDLTIPPSNRLEKLSGSLKNYFSIRINNQWRIIFQWNNGIAEQVKIIDYHK
jgi:proteic killer suppression protein